MPAEDFDVPRPAPTAVPHSQCSLHLPAFRPQLVEDAIARVSGAMVDFKWAIDTFCRNTEISLMEAVEGDIDGGIPLLTGNGESVDAGLSDAMRFCSFLLHRPLSLAPRSVLRCTWKEVLKPMSEPLGGPAGGQRGDKPATEVLT